MSEPTTTLNQETANRTAVGAATQAAAPATPAVTPTATDGAENRKLTRNLVALLIVCGAVFLTLYVWSILARHPRTDDAAARANVVGIVPRVRGPIVKLAVQDNQLVKQGDLLFEIDPADYEQALDKAKSSLASLDEQIDVGRAQDEQLKFGVKAAEAGVQSATAQLKQSEDTLHRLEPLLPKHFATAEQVDEARTKVAVAAQEVAANEQKLNTARAQLSQLQTLLAQRPGAVAAVKQAELDLSYCKVSAPFDGRVINLNISAGAYASVGVPVFSILDTTKWYVVANFRERELRYMAPGSPATVYLVSAPNQRFRGKVQGIGWAVKPEGEVDLPPSGVPYVKRELNWVRVAQRFPVRIEVENPDPDLFRMGASAVAIIDGPAPDK
jgi:membrane fusion protein, multidrug efflux system